MPTELAFSRAAIRFTMMLDPAIDEGLRRIAKRQYTSKTALLNRIARDYVEQELPAMERENEAAVES